MPKENKKRTLIAISGGIAAYKSAELVRALIKQGVEVRVCMTQSAVQFITPLTLQALSGHPVHTDLLDPEAEAGMGHIELARWADQILIAPATANIMAKLAHGIADDLVSTICLASEAPIHLAPAMNRVMWQNEATQSNVAILKQRGFTIHDPADGEQACGETGAGRMLEAQALADLMQANPSSAADLVDQVLLKPLENKQVLITAGPTREAIDPVRYISNRSSGKMGYALAQAAQELGANVTLVSGPVALDAPAGVKRIFVESAKQMHQATLAAAKTADIFIASAAVSDYAPMQVNDQKIKKSDDDLTLALSLNPDILADVSSTFPALFSVGFAAETEKLIEHATAKLKKKKLNMVIANLVGENKGFEVDTNQVKIIWQDGQISLPEQSKTRLAKEIMQIITKHRVNHPVLV